MAKIFINCSMSAKVNENNGNNKAKTIDFSGLWRELTISNKKSGENYLVMSSNSFTYRPLCHSLVLQQFYSAIRNINGKN
jgi:hypothetical protein